MTIDIMMADHPKAENLFNRLISYTPRVGESGQARTALEDFYTEALAWCLTYSKSFRNGFFELLNRNVPKLRLLRDGSDNVEIHTQLSFKEEDAENSNGGRRRFDLVIQSSENENFVIAVEDKIKWAFTESQIPAYQNELKTGERFKNFREKLLVILSPSGRLPDYDQSIPVIAMKWSEIQRKLESSSGLAIGGDPAAWALPSDQFVCCQFAEFLKEKGLAPMQLPKTKQETTFNQGIEFCQKIQKILSQVKVNSEELKGVRKSQPEFYTKDNEIWFSISKNKAPKIWVHFKVWPNREMLVETKWVKGPRELTANHKNMKIDIWKDKSGFGIIGEFTPDYDGNPDKVMEWYENALELAVNLR